MRPRGVHPLGANYALVVAGVAFLALMASAGLRSAPGVLMRPLQASMGWSPATVSTTAAIGILFYGAVGPFVGALMQTVGIRVTLLSGLALMAASTLASLWMTEPWQYLLSWGVFSGMGTGAVASVFGTAVVGRWFAARQGLVMGVLTASTATGSLIFLPTMARLSEGGAWRPVALCVGLACAALIPVALVFFPERPSDVGAPRFGECETAPDPPIRGGSVAYAFDVLARAVREPVFWLLAGSFFVCGLTTNGLVGTHLIAYCGDHGVPPRTAAGMLSMLGLFNLIGAASSGWLTDRFDPKKLLFVYYGLRGLSLVLLPLLDFGPVALSIFAVFYGLDWVATVPPTVKLLSERFGPRDAPIGFGWMQVGHQIGAAIAAAGAGLIRQETGSYQAAFMIAGGMGVLAGVAMLVFSEKRLRLAAA